jgi:periplasmic divalent cation tolerance protein
MLCRKTGIILLNRVKGGNGLGTGDRGSALNMINIITTADEKAILDKIGKTLLEKRLIACYQVIGPMKSVYWWKGSVEETEEWMAIMKTKSQLYDQVEHEIMALHPYEVPQIEAVEATRVLAAYRQWVDGETLAGETVFLQ